MVKLKIYENKEDELNVTICFLYNPDSFSRFLMKLLEAEYG